MELQLNTIKNPREIIFSVLNIIYSNYGGRKVPDGSLVAWHIALDDISDQEIEFGLRFVLKNKQSWLPDSAQFRIQALKFNESKSTEEEFVTLILVAQAGFKDQYGPTPKFDDQEIQKLINRYSWIQVQSMSIDQLKNLYQEYLGCNTQKP